MVIERINSKRYYSPSDIDYVLRLIGGIKFIRTNKKIEYANLPCSFDIETTSFYQSNQLDSKTAIMYEWTCNIDGYTIIGRHWSELMIVMNKISRYYNLNENRIMIIYVHNLAFEFQFIRKRFDWLNIFALEKRKPVKCKTIDGIEFRCSYILSGYSLENLAKQLNKYKCEKLVGDLDYKLLRHSKTTLTEKELSYCINDCMIIVCYIQELIERLGDITKIPLTKTGFVRRYCRNSCLYDNEKDNEKYHKYRNLMNSMKLDAETYKQLKQAFAGGFTHASPFYSRETVENVDSFDETSAYPYAMVSEEFPMSSAERIEIENDEDFKKNLSLYCCLFDIEFENIEPLVYYENYISKSKCLDLEDYEENNGRIVRASRLKLTVTEQDYFIIRKMYEWDNMTITNFKRFRKAYLPRDFVLSVLQLYKDKTELKDIPEKVVEYQVSKENVNACYGMLVTDICRDEIIYNANEEWFANKPNIQDAIDSYNKSVKRFMFYAWGVWVTAYARKNLFSAILEFEDDYVYSDTDSVKGINIKNHLEYFEEYNNNVIEKLKRACIIQKIPFEMTCPKNIHGKSKQLGIWEHETKDNIYKKFKTLGAKRYMVEQKGKISITVSGLNKKIAVPYMIEKFGKNIFDAFDEDLYIPPDYTGKMTHTYIDETRCGVLTDYNGISYEYEELSGVHLENTDYSLSLSETYVNYLLGIKLYEK